MQLDGLREPLRSARVSPGSRQWPSPQSGAEGRQTLVLVGDSPMVNLVNSNLREKRESCATSACACVTSANRCAFSLRCVVSSGNRESEQAATDIATLARSVLLLLSVPDAMTEDEMDDFGMRHGCMHL